MSSTIPANELPFDRAYQEARQHWVNNQLDECIHASKAMLEMLELPAYYRMRALLLLSASVQDRDLAERYIHSVEQHWNYARREKKEGVDDELDACLTDLRETIDAVKDHWAEKLSDDDDDDDDDDTAMASDKEENAGLGGDVEQAADVELPEKTESASGEAPMPGTPMNSDTIQKSDPALPIGRPR